jgi:hypothetical protein
MKKLVIGVVLALIVVFVSGTAQPVQADHNVQTAIVHVYVPGINKTVSGTVIAYLDGNANRFGFNWQFFGTVDYKPASASGEGWGSWTGNGYNGAITEIHSFNIPGIKAKKISVPKVFSAGDSGKNVFIASLVTNSFGTISVPLALHGRKNLPPAFGRPHVIGITNVGSSIVPQLPGGEDGDEEEDSPTPTATATPTPKASPTLTATPKVPPQVPTKVPSPTKIPWPLPWPWHPFR